MESQSHLWSNIAGVEFTLVSRDEVAAQIDSWRQVGRREMIALVNPHSVMWCRRDRAMAEAVSRAGMVLPDGVGIILGARLLGLPDFGRVTGPSLMLHLMDVGRARGYRHVLFGGAEGVATELAQRLRAIFPGVDIVDELCPPFRQLSAEEERKFIDRINASKPDIVWVGLGTRKQETWMARNIRLIRATATIGVGAAFDFHSGRVKWAPRLVRKFGLEWAYRLITEPRRMWRRNLDSPLFLAVVGAQLAARSLIPWRRQTAQGVLTVGRAHELSEQVAGAMAK